MLRIHKRTPPACITTLQQTPGADWGSVTGEQKAEMRKALLDEQGHLCAYCMRRVSADPSACTVEHWRPRSQAGTDPFHWPDLLLVCDGGGPGAAPAHQHCDRRRGNAPLTLHPAHPSQDVAALLAYEADGRIRETPEIKSDITALNLNYTRLVTNRRQVMDVVLQSRGQDATTLRQTLKDWERADSDGKKKEYAGVACYLLRRRIENLEKKAQRMKKTRAR